MYYILYGKRPCFEMNITSLRVGLENGGSDVGVENRSGECFVTEPEAANVHGRDVASEETVRVENPEKSVRGSGSGSAG